MTSAPQPLRAAAAQLRHNSVYMVGVGYDQPLADERSWMYFPDPGVPFYRVTNFAKHAPANVPGGEISRFSSYMTETAYSPEEPEPRAGLEQRVERAPRAVGVVGGAPWLMDHAIFSRGRFGAWRYEIGNMDHSTKMGIDVARRLLGAGCEEVWDG